jgi:hypothetical protein
MLRSATVTVNTDFSQEGFELWLQTLLKNITSSPETVKVEGVKEKNES